jgi:ATP/maltotriose-dependent transcriptional regulator MalT/DNA-binding SARP family transcriptional activator
MDDRRRQRPQAAGSGKLAPPDPGEAIARPRLDGALESVWARGLGWIAGPAGAGKSTLVAEWAERAGLSLLWYRLDGGDADPATFFHYLSRALPGEERGAPPLPVLSAEHALDLPTFARRWFERFAERLEGPTLLVLDDYQGLPDDAALHGMLAAALETRPRSLGVLIVSRRPPPAAFVRLRTHGALAPIGPDALRLTDEEAGRLAARLLDEAPTAAWVDRLNRLAEGWCAGFRLLLEVGGDEGLDAARLPEAGRRVFFDYFAVEVFDRAPPPLRELLLQTSVLPHVTASLAARLTGREDAAEALQLLVDQGFFATRLGDGSVRYHALFRDFLRARLRATRDDEAHAAHLADAARLLADEGAMDDAVELLLEARQWERAAALVLDHAPALLASGRYRTLSRWLSALPARVAERNAWIPYWRGMASVALAPAEALARLEHAFELHEAQGDRAGALITLAGLCEAIVLGRDSHLPLDHWLLEVDRRLGESGFPSAEVAERCVPSFFVAASHRQPDHPRMEEWERELRAAIPRMEDVNHRVITTAVLLNHLTWQGRTASAVALLGSLRESIEPLERCAPSTQILFLLVRGILTWQAGHPEEALRHVDRSLEVARHEGVRVLDSTVAEAGCYALLAADDPDGAERYLLQHPDPLPHRTANRAARLQLHALVHLRRGELAAAAAHLEIAEQLAARAGAAIFDALVHVAAAHLALARGRRRELEQRLRRLRELARRARYRQFEVECALLEAVDGRGEAQVPERLAEAFGTLRELGGTLYPWWSRAAKAELCARALAHDVEPEYVRHLVVLQGLVEHPPPDAGPSWPWRVRVRTLGGFEIEVDGAPLDLGRKAPRRPLELLAALVAMEGRASAERLSLVLYPETDGDAAAAALKTAVARLRKLVGAGAVHVRGGVVSLDPSLVWADALALQRALDRGGDAGLEAVERFYGGAFLPHRGQEWVLTARARLRRQASSRLLREGRARLEAGDVDGAAALSERCLRQVDAASETAFRLLMRCHAARGAVDELAATFARCRERVREQGGGELAPETVELYARLRQRA